MNARRIAAVLFAAAACSSLTACSIKFGFVDDSSSKSSSSSNIKKDNSFISEILDKGYSSTDMGESYTLDGDFSMLDLHGLDDMHSSEWESLSDGDQYNIALNLLNFWAYYGDDASIRFKPSELVSGITDKLDASGDDISVLDAALEFAVPDSTEKYRALIGIIDIDDNAVIKDGSDTPEE